jgi:hypothetical protein
VVGRDEEGKFAAAVERRRAKSRKGAKFACQPWKSVALAAILHEAGNVDGSLMAHVRAEEGSVSPSFMIALLLGGNLIDVRMAHALLHGWASSYPLNQVLAT